jgi:hypothetical protein
MRCRYDPLDGGQDGRAVPAGSRHVVQPKECSMRTFLWCLMAAAVVGFVGGARADEENVPLDKLPKPVVDGVKKRFPSAELKEASKEDENGKTVYEVTIKDQGHNIDVTLTPEGGLVSIERQIEAKDLPKAVTDTMDQKYPKATLKVIEEVVKVRDGKEKLEYYEFQLVTADKKKLEVTVTPDGKINHEEDKSKEKD